MATLNAVNGALLMDEFDELVVSGVSQATSSRIVVNYGPVSFTELRGSFEYGPFGTTGTVTALNQTSADGLLNFRLTDASADAQEIFSLVAESKLELALQVLLSRDDSISGGANNDVLFGYDGRDTIRGGDGSDVLTGGLGADRLVGGTGADTFVFLSTFDSGLGRSARDVITDFSRADGDKIDLWQVDAVSGNEQNDDFTSIVDRFTGASGELRVQATANGYLVSGDVDSDRSADFSFLVVSDTQLMATDFVL